MENVGTHGPYVRSNTLMKPSYSILVASNGVDARAVRPYMPEPASLFSPPLEGLGEASSIQKQLLAMKIAMEYPYLGIATSWGLSYLCSK